MYTRGHGGHRNSSSGQYLGSRAKNKAILGAREYKYLKIEGERLIRQYFRVRQELGWGYFREDRDLIGLPPTEVPTPG